MPPEQTFTERLQFHIKSSGISQAELARRAKCDVATIARLRACEPNRLPPWSLVIDVLWACNFNMQFINEASVAYDAALLQFPRRKTAETRAMLTDSALKAVHTEDPVPKVRPPVILASWAKE